MPCGPTGCFPSNADGWTRFDCTFDNFDDALRAVMSLGAQVQVIAPEDLRHAVMHNAETMAGLYS
jgi:predicted DNA-binding transcriptional regulator YafY